MKKIFTLMTLLALVSFGSIYSQNWHNDGPFPPIDPNKFTGPHSIAVDPDGKVWIGSYYNVAGDTIFNGTSWVATRAIHVYNPDGSEVSFSPIKTITVGGVTDSLIGMTNRGMRVNKDGNIIAGTFDRIHIIDYKTGEGLAKVIPLPTASPLQGVTAPATDTLGNVYTATVAPGWPIQVFSPDLTTYLGQVTDASVGYSRSFEVSADGNMVYWAGYDKHKVKIYSRTDEYSPYAYTDSVLFGFDCESFTWSPDRTLLWASAGSYNDMPNRDPDHVTYYTPGTWYAWDPTTDQIVDSINTTFVTPLDAAYRPRGLAFSPDYQTAYTIYFGGTVPAVIKYTNTGSGISEEGQVVVDGYKLSQNYPNPFNPSTKISFELKASGYTTLKVYDMLGNEVATLVQNELTFGNHSVNFNAANLASGTYLYQLTVNGTRITNKMVLLK